MIQLVLVRGSKYTVLVKPNSTSEICEGAENGILTVRLKSPAIENKANIALVKFFKKNYKVQVSIVAGLKSKKKTILIH